MYSTIYAAIERVEDGDAEIYAYAVFHRTNDEPSELGYSDLVESGESDTLADAKASVREVIARVYSTEL